MIHLLLVTKVIHRSIEALLNALPTDEPVFACSAPPLSETLHWAQLKHWHQTALWAGDLQVTCEAYCEVHKEQLAVSTNVNLWQWVVEAAPLQVEKIPKQFCLNFTNTLQLHSPFKPSLDFSLSVHSTAPVEITIQVISVWRPVKFSYSCILPPSRLTAFMSVMTQCIDKYDASELLPDRLFTVDWQRALSHGATTIT